MSRCGITYEESGGSRYSAAGLRLLSPRLVDLQVFPFSAERQRQEAVVRAGRISIQGVQPKLSVRLNVRKQRFEPVDHGGRYIVKPQTPPYPEVPENEDLTLRLAAACGIETPLHGLLRCADGSLSFFIKRFDRVGRRGRLAVEDFAQLAGRTRETKYDYSIERLFDLLDHATFPHVQRVELWKRLLFSYLVGNEDMHLKNFSLLTRDGRIELAPAYDFVNTTVIYQAMGRARKDIEESALPLRGRKKGLSASLFTSHLGRERLGLPRPVIEHTMQGLAAALPLWRQWIKRSFLSPTARTLYLDLLAERAATLRIR